MDRAKQQAIVDQFIERLGIKTAGPDQPIRELSGGNQQKVLLARWLCLQPRLLILDEPTRGIDVGAKGEIQALINELAEAGLGVLMISSELEELTEGSDRVVVLRDGRTVAELPHGGHHARTRSWPRWRTAPGAARRGGGRRWLSSTPPSRQPVRRLVAPARLRHRRADLWRVAGPAGALLYNVFFTPNFLTRRPSTSISPRSPRSSSSPRA